MSLNLVLEDLKAIAVTGCYRMTREEDQRSGREDEKGGGKK
jgi:hypothetical protein